MTALSRWQRLKTEWAVRSNTSASSGLVLTLVIGLIILLRYTA